MVVLDMKGSDIGFVKAHMGPGRGYRCLVYVPNLPTTTTVDPSLFQPILGDGTGQVGPGRAMQRAAQDLHPEVHRKFAASQFAGLPW